MIKSNTIALRRLALVIALSLVNAAVFAQPGNGAAALTATATTIRSYATSAQTIVLSLGVLIGFIGGIRVYNKMHNGDPDTQKAMVSWFGAALFLVAIGTILSSFFGN